MASCFVDKRLAGGDGDGGGELGVGSGGGMRAAAT
jgi:hypothetical protein